MWQCETAQWLVYTLAVVVIIMDQFSFYGYQACQLMTTYDDTVSIRAMNL